MLEGVTAILSPCDQIPRINPFSTPHPRQLLLSLWWACPTTLPHLCLGMLISPTMPRISEGVAEPRTILQAWVIYPPVFP